MNARVVATLSAFALAAVTVAAQQPTTQSTEQNRAPKANQNITVTGCLSSGPNNSYILTTTPSPAGEMTGTTATTPTGTKVAKTITYTLAGDTSDFKDHVGHTVQVTGREEAPEVSTKMSDKPAGATGTTGTNAAGNPASDQRPMPNANPNVNGTSGAKANVETTTQTQIVSRQLTVGSVKMVSKGCDLVK